MPLSNSKSYNTTSVDGVNAGEKMRSEDFNNFYSQFLSNDEALRGQIADASSAAQQNLTQLRNEVSTSMSSMETSLNSNIDLLSQSVDASVDDLNAKIDKLHNKRTYTLPASSWGITNNPVSQILSVPGMTTADIVQVGLEIPASYTAAQAKAARKAFSFITRAETGIDKITFYCFDTSKYPTVNLPIYVIGV